VLKLARVQYQGSLKEFLELHNPSPPYIYHLFLPEPFSLPSFFSVLFPVRLPPFSFLHSPLCIFCFPCWIGDDATRLLCWQICSNSSRLSPTRCELCTQRRRDSTRQLSRHRRWVLSLMVIGQRKRIRHFPRHNFLRHFAVK